MIAAVVYAVLSGLATIAVLAAVRPVDPDEFNDGVRDGGIYVAGAAVGVIVGIAVGGVG